MGIPRKIADFLRNSFVSSSEPRSASPVSAAPKEAAGVPDGHSLDWQANDETVILKRAEFESLQTELFECAETIKRLKRADQEKTSQIQEYETMFTTFLKKRIGEYESPSAHREGSEDELSKLRASEDRLRSHVSALKRDLIAAESRADELEDRLGMVMERSADGAAALEDELRQAKSQALGLGIENGRLRALLHRRSVDLTELVEYCKYLTDY